MRCPQCGLVHAEADQYCRRCQVDLRTGEARPQEALPSAAVAPPAAQQLLSLLRSAQARVQTFRRPTSRDFAPPPRPVPAPAAAPAKPKESQAIPVRPREPAAPSAVSKVFAAIKPVRNPFTGLVGRMRAARSGLKSLTCIQCSGNMHIERLPAYGPGGPIALIAAGAVILALGYGYQAWPLFLLGPVGVGLGVFYRRRGPSHWHCRLCGYRIPRQD